MGQWGFRFTALSYETLAPRGTWNGVLGFDRDFSERNGSALEVNFAIDLFARNDIPQDGEVGAEHVSYTLIRNCVGLTYRSKYFFSDNSGGAVYLGPLLGFRSLTYDADPNYYDQSSAPAWARKTSTNAKLFPVGLTFGWRAPLEGLFTELNLSVGTQFGDPSALELVYLNEKDLPNKFFFSFQYILGIGWD
jgi:hypothetical protein